ncbi:hypothetical protein [Caldimonas thermodepolymerans]|uniref:Uncharacterized protein n=1 Tax=Caldimonas thermodepolymerans TaxID=215580 RepID=A0AA46DCN8_9BURK|nr:hypothetical protein [Caldimonas thermodepolymerans]TCP06589.1 hypothetical protein EV676_10672 [Caldimonas thermodepolymerans]UZG49355.1 hypothetical protein ONS87_06970 [Caldimonas thermodepolymerans]
MLHRIVPPADIPAPEIRVRGQLQRDARVRYTTRGEPVLECVIAQADGTCIVVRRLYKADTASSIAARSLANQLRQGGLCTAYGGQLARATVDGKRALQLRGVTLIEPR